MSVICRQSGLGSSALSVRQIPPPAAPAHTVQALVFAPQSGETTIVVMRLAVELVAPENDVTPGCCASTCGPYCDQRLPPLDGSPLVESCC